jgi:hypothetical protein
MRILSRVALVVLLGLLLPAVASADFLVPECKLTLVGNNPPASQFALSPHAVFRYGSLVYALRGQTLSTYNVTDLGDMQLAREDFIGSLGARDNNGGVAFYMGFLYLSSEAGLEIYDIGNVKPGGNAPILISRTPGLHYRRLAVNGTTLAALYPINDIPCVPSLGTSCHNSIDLFSVGNPSSPVQIGSVSPAFPMPMTGFNDIVFYGSSLIATGIGGTLAYDISNPVDPIVITYVPVSGSFLAQTGGYLAVGQETRIGLFGIVPFVGSSAFTFVNYTTYTLPALTIEQSNPIMFHPQAWIDDTAGRLITMIDAKDPDKLIPARTIAFDIFDFTIPMYAGSDPRLWETVTYTTPDEVKYNPVAVGPYVYVLGDQSGLQTWGACGQMTGKIDFDTVAQLLCGGAELHGWITGTLKIANVEVFLDGTSLGPAAIVGPARIDVSSRTPVFTWRISVNLDNTPRGQHLLRLVATDINANRRQVASQSIFFNGPGQNCQQRRRSSGKF